MRLYVPRTSGKDIPVDWMRQDSDADQLSLRIVDWRDNSKKNPTHDEILQQSLTHNLTSTVPVSLPRFVTAGRETLHAKFPGYVSPSSVSTETLSLESLQRDDRHWLSVVSTFIFLF